MATHPDAGKPATPDQLIDVVDPPSYEFLEAIITGVEHAFQTN